MKSKTPLIRLIDFVRPFGRWMSLAVALGFFTIAASIGLMTTSAWIISRAALQPSISVLQVAIVGVRFFGISRGVSRYLERYVGHEVTFKLLAQLRVWFYEKIEPLAPARLMAYRSGDLLSRIVADVETLQNFYVRVIAPPVVALLTAILMIILMGAFHLLLIPIIVVFMLLVGVGMPLGVWRLSHQPSVQEITARAELKTALTEGIQGIADLISYGQTETYLHKINTDSQELETHQKRLALVMGLHTGLGVFLVSLCAVILLAMAIPRVDPLYLAPITLGAIAAFEAFLPLSVALQHMGSSLKAAQRLFELVDAEPAIHDPEHTAILPETYDLKIENLTFRYNEEDQPVLVNVSFDIPQGKRVALVGVSGAGKSTLINILLRFWDYHEGKITLGGKDLKTYHQEDVRKLIGVVSQNTHLFNGTIRENLLLANPDATQLQLDEATQHAHLYDFIQSLPDKYETWVGEQGLRLSGGERQRLAIARTLLKNAPLLILDEATANLDTVTEHGVMRTIQKLMEGRTVFIITHRLVQLEDMDEILVLHEGKLVERGTHHTLLAAKGMYQRLFAQQRDILTA
jgi:ATP-binding cassette subfamily C protein CydC